MRIAIVAAPFFLSDYHRNVALETLSSISSSHDLVKIAVVNAVRAASDDSQWLKTNFDQIEYNDCNILARAWNKGIAQAFKLGARYALVINLDLIFHPLAIDNLVKCAEKYPSYYVWAAQRWLNKSTLNKAELDPSIYECDNWGCFMTDARLQNEIGNFDETFAPAYHEDNDMSYRMALKGQRTVTARDALVYHTEAATLKGCLDIKEIGIPERLEFISAIRQAIKINDAKYLAKWGGSPHLETFKLPYNGEHSTR